MDEWHVGDPADWGDSAGVPDIPYMGYLHNGDGEDETPSSTNSFETQMHEAWDLRNEGRLDEALDIIEDVIQYDGHWRAYNIKAIILEDMGYRESALLCYDKALKMTDAQYVKDNMARLLKRMAEYFSKSNEESLDRINQALKLTSDEEDRCSSLRVKANILERMGKEREAYVCIKLANKRPDLVEEFESHSKILKDATDILICIAGTQFYEHFAPFKEGLILDLIKEPENEHDEYAIRVEVDQKKVGYVANSPNTLIEEAKSARQISDYFESRTKAQMMFIFMERYVVAKLI